MLKKNMIKKYVQSKDKQISSYAIDALDRYISRLVISKLDDAITVCNSFKRIRDVEMNHVLLSKHE